jgi:NAD-dependent deacetylase
MHASQTVIPVDLVDRLRSAPRVAVLTGAGVSAESGVPTFREAQTGLWARYRPEELASPQGFQRDPRLV